MRLPSRTLALLAAAVALLVSAFAAPAGATVLSTRLGRALDSSGVARSRTSALAINVTTGGAVFRRNPGTPLRPASNEKLTVALAALDRLGGASRIPTRVLGQGRPIGTVWLGSLILKGYGDPMLTHAKLVALARAIRALGITRVTGSVLWDESYFDTVRTAPGWKPWYYRNECAPLSALVADEADVGGRVVGRPAYWAAVEFRSALVAAGIRVVGGIGKGRAGATAVPLARVVSPRLWYVVRRMDRPSNNFIAEMLVKELGARMRGHGTTAAGLAVVRSVLAARGVPLTGVRLVDGSGLSSWDRLTGRAIAALLLSAWSDARVHGPFVGSLAVAGVNGTLHDRMRTGPAHRVVRAKTGTTNLASALSGYVGSRYIFAILFNGTPVPIWSSQAAEDRFAQVLAGTL